MSISSSFLIEKRCPSCSAEVDESCFICPNCGYLFSRESKGLIHDYGPSSATAYTSSFTELANEFEKDPSEKKKKEDLTKGNITESILVSYVNWGYLESWKDEYGLTGIGKEAFYKNRESMKKLKKGIEEESENG